MTSEKGFLYNKIQSSTFSAGYMCEMDWLISEVLRYAVIFFRLPCLSLMYDMLETN